MKKEYEVRHFYATYERKFVEADSFEAAAEKALYDQITGKWEQSELRMDGEEIYVFDTDGNDFLYIIPEGEIYD